MLLELDDGRSFSLNIDGYEFPNEELVPTEDNPADDFDRGRFLVITVSFKTPDGHWRVTGPEMTTIELERYAAWLESISNGNHTENGVYFTERDLEFSLNESAKLLNVHLSRDFLPPWSKESRLTISFPLPQLKLSDAVSSIYSRLARFPHRPIPN